MRAVLTLACGAAPFVNWVTFVEDGYVKRQLEMDIDDN